jgi:DNA-binding CsgD family transcriptional regulator
MRNNVNTSFNNNEAESMRAEVGAQDIDACGSGTVVRPSRAMGDQPRRSRKKEEVEHRVRESHRLKAEGLTPHLIAQRLGISRSSVLKYLAILPKDVQGSGRTAEKRAEKSEATKPRKTRYRPRSFQEKIKDCVPCEVLKHPEVAVPGDPETCDLWELFAYARAPRRNS